MISTNDSLFIGDWCLLICYPRKSSFKGFPLSGSRETAHSKSFDKKDTHKWGKTKPPMCPCISAYINDHHRNQSGYPSKGSLEHPKPCHLVASSLALLGFGYLKRGGLNKIFGKGWETEPRPLTSTSLLQRTALGMKMSRVRECHPWLREYLMRIKHFDEVHLGVAPFPGCQWQIQLQKGSPILKM